ncbi:hypothetical protein [Soonwooa buanensis]|uniref:hypothetical protein n=1 Tax=Soonwooa buanensis TaxID=619805 RepID=UPI00135631F5|nr:hypothetical protein [Soonwooa buanensis]
MIFIIIYLNTLLAGICNALAANGKSIGEVRAFEELKVQERPSGADAFSDCLN